MKRVNVFVGNYGSGKTEIAVNTALLLKKTHRDVVLIDIDVVNPYFRSSEHRAMLEKEGVRVSMPEYANTGVDLPTLPPGIHAELSGDAGVVLDCGGDPAGATALGTLQPHLAKIREETAVYFVLNACRPLQQTARQAAEMARMIEAVSRLRVTGIINNTNIAEETGASHLLSGQTVAREVSRQLGVPLSYMAGTQAVLDACVLDCPQEKTPRLPLRIFMRPYWL